MPGQKFGLFPAGSQAAAGPALAEAEGVALSVGTLEAEGSGDGLSAALCEGSGDPGSSVGLADSTPAEGWPTLAAGWLAWTDTAGDAPIDGPALLDAVLPPHAAAASDARSRKATGARLMASSVPAVRGARFGHPGGGPAGPS